MRSLTACLCLPLVVLACSSSSPTSSPSPAPAASGSESTLPEESASSGDRGTGGGAVDASAAPVLGGSAKIRTCKNQKLNHPRTATDDACDLCDATQCAKEGAAVLGTDPNAFGGACAELIACTCACDATDKACLAACPLPSDECTAALTAARACEKERCAAACAK